MSEVKSMMGKCEYCGAEIGVIAKSQAEANELASEKCDCSSARTAQKKRMLAEKLKELAGDGCLSLIHIFQCISCNIQVIQSFVYRRRSISDFVCAGPN